MSQAPSVSRSTTETTAASSIKCDYLADLVHLSAAQLQSSIGYLTNSEGACTRSLLEAVSSVTRLEQAARAAELPDARMGVEFDAALQSVSASAKAALSELQFVDALSQRLSHILFEMNQIAGSAESAVTLDTPESWKELLSNIRSKYSIHEEREVFDAAIADTAIGALLDLQGANTSSDDTSIEMF